ncbi:MAG: hypothetical protein A2Y03_08225 [Omnitrophica WOR_2 bacterium GWF2_38_59]|nr:MAG: hypothetical protein A2Y06_01500 [Omnitrophica WOR_2 bacterium GWA2_37_7]OGX25478.1 MAG: hypothetical protein A2Y03_08225 [Omnitrophica WOR_2 bacterium GWF2_38_59]OGX48130.1 MAG: hypothetical protein A2243_02950 [Omnitrophica WOR_2 bacterium RIFOXYA2_FULL_38_17]OGX54719.1 MAG: hypothetical protein A2267_08400 [Omnitrophica WOR_2 bacterium RIFOXYA12_FULL_38_10]OGX56410.1 MAG: hypothetical protein A2447_10440 [Omnitrophica WOR_2 bacterium RIFOXYC2_FULL_38_12]OGX58466.1 MAG: hypothetical 
MILHCFTKDEMKKRLKILYMFLFVLLHQNVLVVKDANSSGWREERGKHFIIKYPSSETASWARDILNKSEIYYDKVAQDIGYARYRNFWTWDNRAVITIYSDRDAFVEATGQPEWSRGGVVGHKQLSNTRSIISFVQEGSFVDETLPHEISHLILWDFIGFEKVIPMWFEEGVAQLQEAEKAARARHAMKGLIEANEYVPFDVLFNVDIRDEEDSLKVTVFYLESYTIVKFLIDEYGNQRFGSLCRNLRDGKNFESALKDAYVLKINSVEDLEKKWLSYMKKQ